MSIAASNIQTPKEAFNFWHWARHNQLPSLFVTIALGAMAAVLIALSPKIGVAAVFGLIAYGIICNRPELAFAILILSFGIPVQKSLAGLPLNMTDGTIVLWGLAWPFLMVKKHNKDPKAFANGLEDVKIPKVFWLSLPLVVASMISLISAENFSGSLKQAIRMVEWFLVLPILFMSLQYNKTFWYVAASMFLIVPPFFALDGVVEVLNHGKSISHYLHIPVPVPPKELSEIRHTFDVSGRAGSTFGGAQGLAMYLTMMMAMIMAIIIKPPAPIFRFFGIIAMIICLAGMFFAKSRGGFLGCLVMLTVTCLVAYPKATFRILLIGGITIALAFIGFLLFFGWDGTIAGMIPGRAEAVLDRLIIWQRALSVFSENPINGVGFGGFRDAVYNNGGIQLNVGLGYASLHCHNTYLEVLTGTGLLGFAAYVTFLFLTWKNLLRRWFDRPDQPTDCFILGAVGAMGAYMMFGMVDMLFLQNMHMTLITTLSLGFIAAGEKERIIYQESLNKINDTEDA